jgi:hypothetical protein
MNMLFGCMKNRKYFELLIYIIFKKMESSIFTSISFFI